jgi:carboxylesterase
VQPDETPTDPFFWPAGPVGCLLLHGLTSTPYEMRSLGEHLHAAGYSVAGVRLAGHGSSEEDLERTAWRDWYSSAGAAADEIAGRCERVVAIGLSMGALLALHLAHERPGQITGLVLLSSALRVSSRWSGVIGRLRFSTPLLPLRLRFIAKPSSDIADPEARRRQPGYRRIPLRAVAELDALQRRVRRLLPDLHQPALVIHARQDHTAPLENLRLLRRLPGLHKVVVLEESYHVITVDREKQRVAEEVVGFLDHLVESVTRPLRCNAGEGEP